jgi:hypothetical protein
MENRIDKACQRRPDIHLVSKQELRHAFTATSISFLIPVRLPHEMPGHWTLVTNRAHLREHSSARMLTTGKIKVPRVLLK